MSTNYKIITSTTSTMLNLQGASIDEFFKDKEHALYLTANQLLRSKLWGTFQFISPNSGSGGAGAGGMQGEY